LGADWNVRLLIAYDVATTTPAGRRRLRRVAQACQDHGHRVQKSVFECQVDSTQWAVLRLRLLDEMDASKDSLRVYYLEADVQIEHHGVGKPVDLEGPLVI
jgi:CRISPR-associated protein Cas2